MFDIDIQEKAAAKPKCSKRMPFKAEEDEKLRELVEKYGDTNWKLISSYMPNRSVRQCRERWNNNLNSNVLKDKWSPQEDELLKRKFYEFGPKWKLLENFFPGRTSYNIRNRWSCIVRLWNIYSSSNLKIYQTSPKNLNQNKIQTKKSKNQKRQMTIIENKYTENQMKIVKEEFETKTIPENENFDHFPSKVEELDDSIEFDELFFQESYFDCF